MSDMSMLARLAALLKQDEPQKPVQVPNYFPQGGYVPQAASQDGGGGMPPGLNMVTDQFMSGGGGAAPSAPGAGGMGNSLGGSLGSSAAGPAGGPAGAGGMSGLMGAATPFAYAAAIGLGKNTEANHANTPVGDMLLGGLAPSGAQMLKDPIGMGLPTLLGAPFLTPFTASKEAKAEKPEWSGLFGLGF